MQTRSRNNGCRGSTIIIAYSECVSVALVIQHTKLRRCIILSFEPCLAEGGGEDIELKMCILIFSTTFV